MRYIDWLGISMATIVIMVGLYVFGSSIYKIKQTPIVTKVHLYGGLDQWEMSVANSMFFFQEKQTKLCFGVIGANSFATGGSAIVRIPCRKMPPGVLEESH